MSTLEWSVYIVRCQNGYLYTGITTDIGKRMDRHNSGKGSKAVRSFGTPVELVYTEGHHSRSTASKKEYFIKSLSKVDKEKFLLSVHPVWVAQHST